MVFGSVREKGKIFPFMTRTHAPFRKAQSAEAESLPFYQPYRSHFFRCQKVAFSSMFIFLFS
jgi:hypothetical protein